MKDAEKGANARMSIDLEAQTVTTSDGEVFSFEVDSFKKHCLMSGLDDIGLTLDKQDHIDAFEAQAAQTRPWVWSTRRPCLSVDLGVTTQNSKPISKNVTALMLRIGLANTNRSTWAELFYLAATID